MKRRVWLGLRLSSLVFVLMFVAAEPASADNCGTPDDCFSTAQAGSDALLGLGFLAGLSLFLNMLPVVGWFKGAFEFVTGRDSLTGRRLSGLERFLGIIPWGGVFRGGRAVGGLDDVARGADDAVDLGRGVRPVEKAKPRPQPGGQPPVPPPPGRGGPPGGRGGGRNGGRSADDDPWPGGPRNFDQKRQARWYSGGRQPDARTPGEYPKRVVRPSRPPHSGNEPTGGPAVHPNPRVATSENRTANVAAQHGFDVHIRQHDGPLRANDPAVVSGELRAGTNPDYVIEGRYFDNKRITSHRVDNIYSEITESIGRQSQGVVLDMTKSRVTNDELVDLLRTQKENAGLPVQGEVWVRRGDDLLPIWP